MITNSFLFVISTALNKLIFISFSFKEALNYNVSLINSNYDDILFYDEEGNNITEEGMRELENLDEAFDKMVSQVK